MLKTYFLILDAYEDGLKLLDSAPTDPVRYVKGLDEVTLRAQLKVWDTILRRQCRRLYEAQSYISAQSYLAVIAPDAQKSIGEVLGNKMDRVATLHGSGAGLFFRSTFPVQEIPESVAELVVQVLTMQEGGTIDQAVVLQELVRLKEGLDAFRDTVTSFVQNDDFHSLADEARNATRLSSV